MDLSQGAIPRALGRERSCCWHQQHLLILPQPCPLDVCPAWALSRRQAKHCLAIGFFAVPSLRFGAIFLYNTFFAPSINSLVSACSCPLPFSLYCIHLMNFSFSHYNVHQGGQKRTCSLRHLLNQRPCLLD